jgi:hypothetical protein
MSREMSFAERQAFLAEPRVATLRVSIVQADRGPLAVPVWYLYEPGGDVRFWTAGASRKARLLLLAAQRYLGREAGERYLASIGGPTAGSGDLLVHLRPEHWLSQDITL